MISQTAEYALRAVVCLAGNSGSPMTTQAIAKTTLIPSGYLAKVLQALGRADLVHSYRGLNGGFVLSREPEVISLLQVIRAVDSSQRIKKCPLSQNGEHNGNGKSKLCSLHAKLDSVMEVAEQSLSSTTIAHLLNECGECGALCEVRTHEEAAAVAKKEAH